MHSPMNVKFVNRFLTEFYDALSQMLLFLM